MAFDSVVPALIVLVGALVACFSTLRILSLRTRSYPAWRKSMDFIVLSLAALAGMALAGNSVFDALVSRSKCPPGATYVVSGHKMRIDCTGSGLPTIVLDAGLGNDGLIWSDVQNALAKTTRVCSYDRAGFGWSDALPPPRDADHIAAELHGLLMAARIDGPIVLMGHSIAGLYIRDYATRYPSNVAGLVFVDSSTPPQNDHRALEKTDAGRTHRRIGALLERGAFNIGLPRLFGACPGSLPGYKWRNTLPRLEGLCHENFEAYVGEQENFDRSSEEISHAGSYGTLPVLIFSRDTANTAWNQGQERLKKLSTHSYRIVARRSGHYIQLERPELLERDVQIFLKQIREPELASAKDGSTTIE